MRENDLEQISRLVRCYILEATTAAGSGHATSSLSAVELMVGLLFGGEYKYKVNEPSYVNNDRLIFSKGHAAPLLYSLWTIAGAIEKKELLTLRKFGSRLQGHPTRDFPWAEVATGSLGQGLSVGLGMALSARMDGLSFRTYVLMGDSEMAEGQNWEAMQLASFYGVDNLVGIVDINRLGQRGETMQGWTLSDYERKCKAFGWNAVVVDGHNVKEILGAYQAASFYKNKPTIILAKTIKGKGVSFLEDKDGWHGKALNEEELEKALGEIGEVGDKLKGVIEEPINEGSCHLSSPKNTHEMNAPSRLSSGTHVIGAPSWGSPDRCHPRRLVQYVEEEGELDEVDKSEDYEKPMATRKAYGHALVEMYPKYPQMVVLDAEMSNSTFAETFKDKFPERFFEMFIAEQNMVSVAVGMALRGKIPFVSTFASFFTRAVDQIRVAQYSKSGVNFVGSHVGVSIGEDGPTQMGLEDIAIFRAIFDSVVLYPVDHVSQEKLAIAMVEHDGICYMRTTRMDTEPLYSPEEEFVIGGSKTLRVSDQDKVTVVAAGVTLYEALKAYEMLKDEGIIIRVIDLYSIKPLDVNTLVKACKETKALVVVEDHFAEGGMAEAVRSALIYETIPIHSLAVRKMPRSGKPEELLRFEEIDSEALVKKVREILVS